MMIELGFRPFAQAIWLGLWGLGIVVGLCWSLSIDSRPGTVGDSPTRWNAAIPIPIDPRRSTLLVFLHPKCPCSRATVGELEALIERVGSRVSIETVLLQPPAGSPGWKASSLETKLSTLSGVRIHRDEGGSIARRFGVETSGHVLLYGPDGALRFSGGITDGRGLYGESAGSRMLVAAIVGQGVSDTIGRVDVFGCPLETPLRVSDAEALSWTARRP